MSERTESISAADRSSALLRTVALAAIVVSGLCSAALTLYAGRHNASLVLPILFLLWVLSPFAAFVLAHARSKRWRGRASSTLHWATLPLTLGSLAIYACAAMGPGGIRTTRFFVVVPLAAWVLIGVLFGAASLIGRARRNA